MPGTTPRGYPYPLPTEPVAEGAAAIRALAERIDSNSGLELIEAKTLAAAGPLSFAAIPQIYSDLRLRLSGLKGPTASAVDSFQMTFNGVTAAGYNTQRQWATGATLTADVVTAQGAAFPGFCPGASAADPNVRGVALIDIFAYRITGGPYVQWLASGQSGHMGSAGARIFQSGGFWYGVGPPVTALSLGATGAVFNIGARAELYGVK